MNEISESEKKGLYFLLNQTLVENREDILLSESPTELSKILLKQMKLLIGVKKADIMFYDLKTLKNLLEVAIIQGKNISFSELGLTLPSINRSILKESRCNGLSVDFEKLGEFCLRRSRTAPHTKTPFIFGLGDFSLMVKQKAKRNVSQTQRSVISTKENVSIRSKPISRSQVLASEALKLYQSIEESGHTPLSRVIESSNGFSHVIHKAFHFAHLVRDGHVQIKYEDSEIITSIVSHNNHEKIGRKKCIMHLTYEDYFKYNNPQNENKDIVVKENFFYILFE